MCYIFRPHFISFQEEKKIQPYSLKIRGDIFQDWTNIFPSYHPYSTNYILQSAGPFP